MHVNHKSPDIRMKLVTLPTRMLASLVSQHALTHFLLKNNNEITLL
jgi:hypothetical protein